MLGKFSILKCTVSLNKGNSETKRRKRQIIRERMRTRERDQETETTRKKRPMVRD
jgi:hypothetical protein